MVSDVDEFAAHVVATIKAAIAPLAERNVELAARIALLEARELLHGRDGRDGLSIQGSTGERGPRGEPGANGTEGAEGRTGEQGLPGRDGKSVDAAEVDAMVEARVQKAIAALPVPSTAIEHIATNVHGARGLVDMLVKEAVAAAVDRMPAPQNGQDGQSVSVADLVPAIVAEVQRAVAELPVPRDGTNGQDGKSIERDAVEQMVRVQVGRVVAELPAPKNGQDGASVDAGAVIETVMGLLDSRVKKALASIPTPQDGRSVTLEDVEPLIVSVVEKAVAAVPVPKDGVGLSGALLGRAGNLLVTLTDGTVRDVGMVVGRDVDMAEVRNLIVEEVGKLPKPKDGERGEPGQNGTLDGLKVMYDGQRIVTFCHKDGTVVEGGVIRLPIPIDRGVYKDGISYERGDGVTLRGSWFLAQRDTAGVEKPEDATGAFRLTVKRGQDGKAGLVGKQGPEGKPGRDSTMISPDRPRF